MMGVTGAANIIRCEGKGGAARQKENNPDSLINVFFCFGFYRINLLWKRALVVFQDVERWWTPPSLDTLERHFALQVQTNTKK